MAALTGNQIDQSYQGLIKTTDNAALSGTAKALTDGVGGATNIQMSNTATNFVSGTVDFTGSTVSGLPGGGGLESGTGTDSMQSASSLTTNAANASGQESIALGDNATSSAPSSIAIGKSAAATGSDGSISIGGVGNTSGGTRTVTIGSAYNTCNGVDSVNFGFSSTVNGLRSGAIGGVANTVNTSYSVALGGQSITTNKSDEAVCTLFRIAGNATNMLMIDNYATLAFADDAAAATGGVPLGGVYQNSGVLQIRIA